jgi:polypeptide N-acetylgalactosaminyltransferase
MKVCSLKRLLKYSILISATSLITTVVFHFVRQPNRNGLHFQANKHFDYESVNRVGRSKRIDWHDEELILSENEREGSYSSSRLRRVESRYFVIPECLFSGNGEHGKPAKLPDGYEKSKYDDLYGTNGFNALLSDYISINRSLPDIRHKE